MPRDFITADTGFPNLTGNETVEEKVDRLYDYTFMLLESLRYVLRNLDADNFNTAAVDEFRKAYKDNAVEALAAFKAEANDTYAKAEMLAKFENDMNNSYAAFTAEANATYATTKMLTEFENDMNNSYAAFTAEANATYATTTMFSAFETSQKVEFNNFKNEQQTAYNEFTQTQSAALAEIKTTADENASSITQLSVWKEDFIGDNGDFKTLQDNVASITQTANINGAFIRMLVSNETLSLNDNGDLVDNDGNAVGAEIAASFIMEAANGSSSIKLNADRISFGKDAGVYGDGNLYLLKLFGKSNVAIGNLPGWFYLELDSDLNTSDGIMGGDLVIKSVAEADSWTGKDTTLYGFRYGVSPGNQTTSVNFVVSTDQTGGETSIIGYNYSEEKTYPKGVWDFSSCDITGMTGLAVYFS